MYKIDLINENDIKDIFKIESKSFEFPWKEHMFKETIFYSKFPQFKLIIKNKIVGYIFYNIVGSQNTHYEAEILNIAIHPEYRQKGLAKKLLTHCIKYIKTFARVVFLEVRIDNIPAINLYNKLGFTKIGTRKKYYNGKIDAIVMKKEL